MTASMLLPALAVLGPSAASEDEQRVASAVGRLAAHAGWAVVSGGGPGVMAAACRGAASSGGLTVGILPTSAPAAGYPNPWVKVAIYTGAGMSRNVFNVLSARLCVAIGGGPGTLSEIALALKGGVPVWCHRSWALVPPRDIGCQLPRVMESEEQLLRELALELARLGG